mgnify:CR=1 FL=1
MPALVLALARQVGILHERVSPAGALQPTSGPKVGELTTKLDLRTLAGSQVVIGGENKKCRIKRIDVNESDLS